MDLAGDAAGAELIARTKLVRHAQLAAVCLSEAISHEVLRVVGLAVADAHAVVVEPEFAADLSAQFGFAPPVQAGRHWGTTLLVDCAAEVEFGFEHLKHVARTLDLFTLFLADVLLANPDRRTMGNVLLRTSADGKLNVVPIDQSDCFNHPSCLCDRNQLLAARTETVAQWLDGTESVVLDADRGFPQAEVDRFKSLRVGILDAIEVPPDEWYTRAGVDPDDVRDFLDFRLNKLDELADLGRWNGLHDATRGGYVLL